MFGDDLAHPGEAPLIPFFVAQMRAVLDSYYGVSVASS